jgi:SAM-dependent methyltransferase
MTAYNKVCNIEDFETLRDDIWAFVPEWSKDDLHRKWWEIIQVMRAFRDFGVLRPDAEVLGVGVGTEPTTYLLTKYVHRVHATDLYADAGVWSRESPAAILTNPERYAPKYLTEWRPERLIVQHMDMCSLRYPDGAFDGVYSCSSIEHVGNLDRVRHALQQIARVLKPGGIAAIATEFALDKPDRAWSWPGVLLFRRESIMAVLPDGLELVDQLDEQVSQATLMTAMRLDEAIRDPKHRPHIVLQEHGIRFTSVFLALRKVQRNDRGN